MTSVVVHHGWVKQETYVRTNQTGLYVRIKVAFEPQSDRSVDNACERLGDDDGADEEYYAAATSGAMSALHDAETGGSVTILEVEYAPAHTSPQDVRVASSIAVGYVLRR
jgi:hypothetical protein